jgi:hypothetical protein
VDLGWCKYGDYCFYTHDRDKTALCLSVTRGINCSAGEDCLFSHKPTLENLPTCLYFLEGRCNRSNCVFAHVSIPLTAVPCEDFATLGYCGKGGTCEDLHLRQCPSYARSGACSRARCSLSHVDTNNMKSLPLSSDTGFGTDPVGRSANDDRVGDRYELETVMALETQDEAKGVTMHHEFSQQQDFIRL